MYLNTTYFYDAEVKFKVNKMIKKKSAEFLDGIGLKSQ